MLTDEARRELAAIAPGGPTAVTIGVFDGVHLGHRRLIDRLLAVARAADLTPVILTFDPAPVAVLRPDLPLSFITTIDERIERLHEAGVAHVGRLTFSAELAAVSAQDFIAGIRDALDMRVLVGGRDIGFGRGREGTVAWLEEHAPALGFRVETVDFLADAGHKMGSSGIRAALAEGDVEQAARLLGRPHVIHGPVVHGAHRGRTIGVPTDNIEVAAGLAVPAFGVYVTRTTVGDHHYPSVSNIGRRPTFDNGLPSVETYLLDFDGDLYGGTIRVELLKRLRGEERFASVEALLAQIQEDIAAARRHFAENA